MVSCVLSGGIAGKRGAAKTPPFIGLRCNSQLTGLAIMQE